HSPPLSTTCPTYNPPTETYTLSLHDALPISKILQAPDAALKAKDAQERFLAAAMLLAKYRTRKSANDKTEAIAAEQSKLILKAIDRKSTRLNSSHQIISYAVFCLKKKTKTEK